MANRPWGEGLTFAHGFAKKLLGFNEPKQLLERPVINYADICKQLSWTEITWGGYPNFLHVLSWYGLNKPRSATSESRNLSTKNEICVVSAVSSNIQNL